MTIATIDIGGTGIKFASLTPDGKILDKTSTPTPENLEDLLAWLDQHQSEILQLIAARSRLAPPSQPQIAYAAFWLEDNASFCDFAVSAANWGEQLAECALENGELTFSQISHA